jgi:hypothetical protein
MVKHNIKQKPKSINPSKAIRKSLKLKLAKDAYSQSRQPLKSRRHNISRSSLQQVDDGINTHIDTLQIELPKHTMRSIWKKNFNLFQKDMSYSFKTINPVVLIGGLISLPSKIINLVFNFYKDVSKEYKLLGLANKLHLAPIMAIVIAPFVPEIALLKLTEVVGKSLIEIGKGNGLGGMYDALSSTMNDFSNQLKFIFNLEDVSKIDSHLTTLNMSQASQQFLVRSAMVADGIEMLDASRAHQELLTKAIRAGIEHYLTSNRDKIKDIGQMQDLLNNMLQSNQKVTIDLEIFQNCPKIKNFFITKGKESLHDTPHELLKSIVTGKFDAAEQYQALKEMTAVILAKHRQKVWSADTGQADVASSSRSHP